MKPEFTPGPWRIKLTERFGPWVVDDNGWHVAEVSVLHREIRTREETDANARLIAAAPDLLEALLVAHDHIDMAALEISHCKDAEQIRAAIAKSRGQEG